MPPNVPKIPGGPIVKERQSRGLLVVQLFVCFNWADDWDKTYRTMK
jgi:hypothetical protein